MDVYETSFYHMDDDDHTSYASCMYDGASFVSHGLYMDAMSMDAMSNDLDELPDDSGSVQEACFLSSGLDEESYLKQLPGDRNPQSTFFTGPGNEVFEKEGEECGNCAALKALVTELQNQFGAMQAKLSQMEINVATMPTSQVELLETMVEHQGTRIQTLEQEKEHIRKQLNDLEVKVRAPTTVQDPQDTSSRGGSDRAHFLMDGGYGESDSDDQFDIQSIYSNDHLDMSLMSELGTSVMQGSNFESSFKGRKGMGSTGLSHAKSCSTTVESASQSEYNQLNHSDNHDALLGRHRRIQGPDRWEPPLDQDFGARSFNSSLLQGQSHRSNVSKTHFGSRSMQMLPSMQGMSMPTPGKHVRSRSRFARFSSQHAQHHHHGSHHDMNRSKKFVSGVVADPLFGSFSGRSVQSMMHSRPHSPSSYLASASDRVLNHSRRGHKQLLHHQVQQSSEQPGMLESHRSLKDCEQAVTSNHTLDTFLEEAMTVEYNERPTSRVQPLLKLEGDNVKVIKNDDDNRVISLSKQEDRDVGMVKKVKEDRKSTTGLSKEQEDRVIGTSGGVNDGNNRIVALSKQQEDKDSSTSVEELSVKKENDEMIVEEARQSLDKLVAMFDGKRPPSPSSKDNESSRTVKRFDNNDLKDMPRPALCEGSVKISSDAGESQVKCGTTDPLLGNLQGRSTTCEDGGMDSSIESLPKECSPLEDEVVTDEEVTEDTMDSSVRSFCKEASTLENGSENKKVAKVKRSKKSKSLRNSRHDGPNSTSWKSFNVRIML